MVVVNGRIVDFLIDRCEDGYAEFLFKSDYDKDCPRFEAICSGKIPDVVPGVPIKVEFRVETVNDIIKIDFKALKIEQITKFVKTKYMNETAYTCINFNDEEYAKTLLTKVKGISAKIANRILEAVDGDISRLSGMWDDKDFWKGFRGSKRYLAELKDTVGSMLEKDYLVKKYQKYGIGYPQIDMLAAIYGLEAEEKLCHNPYAVLYRLELDFQVADNLAKDLNFDYLAPERVTHAKNGNGCIFGVPGSGKSFSAKREIVNVLLNTDDEVFVIDPENEYAGLAKMFYGSSIRIAPGSGVHINPMDMSLDYSPEDGDDPIVMKSDFIASICEAATGTRYPLTPIQKSVIDRCVKNVYKDYMFRNRYCYYICSCNASAKGLCKCCAVPNCNM